MGNRHDVIIWDADIYGVPKSFDEALEMADVLSVQSENNHSIKLRQFAAKLSQFAKTAENEDVWQGYQQLEQDIAHSSYAAFVLEMPRRGWECVLSEVVKLANTLNLIVVDEEAIMVFLPNNQLLPIENLAHWQAIKALLKENAANHFPKTLKQFKKWMEPQCDAMLAKHGFTEKVITGSGVFAKDPWYKRLMGECMQYIQLEYFDLLNSNNFSISVSFALEHPSIRAIYDKTNFFKYPFSFLFNINTLNKITTEFVISNSDTAIDFLEKSAEILFPMLDNINNIKGVDYIVNGDSYGEYRVFSQKCFFMPQCLIAAKLSNNPDFERLAKELGAYDSQSGRTWGGHAPHQITEWPKLVNYLREEVP